MNQPAKSKPNFARSAESIRIENRLAQLKVGDEISYDELDTLAPGLKVRGPDRCKMYSAIRACLQQKVDVDGEPLLGGPA